MQKKCAVSWGGIYHNGEPEHELVARVKHGTWEFDICSAHLDYYLQHLDGNYTGWKMDCLPKYALTKNGKDFSEDQWEPIGQLFEERLLLRKKDV